MARCSMSKVRSCGTIGTSRASSFLVSPARKWMTPRRKSTWLKSSPRISPSRIPEKNPIAEWQAHVIREFGEEFFVLLLLEKSLPRSGFFDRGEVRNVAKFAVLPGQVEHS